MEVSLLTVGRLKAGPERDLVTRYLERARKTGGGLGLRGFSVKEVAEGRAARPADRMQEEADALSRLAGEGGRIVCLDAAGELVTSVGLAQMLAKEAEVSTPRMAFIIGGPDGLSREFLASADRRLSFGRVTWPHQFMRVLLAEQLYRAATILSGHPYHRA